jgi:hypothetical protein
MTGYSVAAEDAVRAGFTVLRKPYRKADLQDAVTRALASTSDPAPVSDAPPAVRAAVS